MIKLEDLLVEAGFMDKVKSLGKSAADWLKSKFPEMRPAEPGDLVAGKEYRIVHNEPGGSYATGFAKLKSKWLAIAIYEGKKGYHLFTITDLYKDFESGTGNAPSEDEVIQFDDAEIKKFVQVPVEGEKPRDAKETQ